jgi:hypothetical protein
LDKWDIREEGKDTRSLKIFNLSRRRDYITVKTRQDKTRQDKTRQETLKRGDEFGVVCMKKLTTTKKKWL